MDRKGMAEVMNPHATGQEDYNQTCSVCHADDPYKTGNLSILPEGLTEICRSCHQNLLSSCQKAVTPETTKILLEQIPTLVLTTEGDSLTCVSCHLVHAEPGKGLNGLKDMYFLFLKQAEKINPHKSGIFCIFCHDREPKEETDPLRLKFNGDRVAVCIQCHNNVRARADNHPVNIQPSEGKGVKLDDRFPLFEGKVTCITCHDVRCDIGATNPKFLRGGPYEARVDACLECHRKESYKAVNPHEQIDEQGQLRKDRCLYCHIIDIMGSM